MNFATGMPRFLFGAGMIAESMVKYICFREEESRVRLRSGDYSHMLFNVRSYLLSLFCALVISLHVEDQKYPSGGGRGDLKNAKSTGKTLAWILAVFSVFNSFML